MKKSIAAILARRSGAGGRFSFLGRSLSISAMALALGASFLGCIPDEKTCCGPGPQPPLLSFLEAKSVFVSNGEVYVAGCQRDTSISQDIHAVQWKNGAKEVLSRYPDTEARSVFVFGSDMYVAGFDKASSANIATLWKNGAAQQLTDNHSEAYSVFVSGDDVYVAGYEYKKESRSHGSWATLWKNGEAQYLDDSTWVEATSYVAGSANSIFVSGDDVYVAGTEFVFGRGNVAALWKNGEVQHLDDVRYGEAHSVFVSGDDVYVAGSASYGGALLWKNGEVQHLDDARYGEAHSVFVFGDDVYVAGHVGVRAVLWKNGEAQYLSDSGQAKANSVFVYGGDTYVAGQSDYKAAVWKNGVAEYLAHGGQKAP